MAPTFELVEQIFKNSPTTLTSASAQWLTHSEHWSLCIEAHAPGVYRLRWGPNTWIEPKKPNPRFQRRQQLLLAREEAVGELHTEPVDPSGWSLAQGNISLQLGVDATSIRLLSDDKTIFQAEFAVFPAADNTVWEIDIPLTKSESIYGLGESTKLERRAIITSDNPKDRALPLAWSPNGWGIYVNTLDRVVHDTKSKNLYQIKTSTKGLDLFIFSGDPSEILNQYTALTGRAGQPELWSMGVWLDQAPGQSLTDSLEQIKSLRKQEIALDTLVLSDPAVLTFQADKPVVELSERVGEWRDLSAQLEDLGIHLAGSSYPGVLQGTALFDEWEDRGWLLTDAEGDAWICSGTPASGDKPFGLLDLTHKDAAKLWSERLQQLVEEGFGAVLADAQFDFPDDVDARGGESGALLRTLYPHLAREALFNATAAWRTPQEGVMPSRDLFPSVQRYAWQRGPAVTNTWAGFANTLKSALSVGNSGVAVQTHMLGNALAKTDGMTAELYLRWLAMAVFSANFSFQGIPALMPDNFDVKTRKLISHWLEWRYRLLPYITGIVDDAVRTGLPVQRSMAQAFPDDKDAHKWDCQYLLGPALLVAPVMQSGDTAEIYLPKGEAWWDLRTGWRYEGGTTWTIKVGLDTIPVFGREGHMLCIGQATQHTGEINSARILEEVWMFGMPEHNPVVMRNKIRVMQMQGSSYIKGLEGLKILPSEGLEVKRRGAEVRISRAR